MMPTAASEADHASIPLELIQRTLMSLTSDVGEKEFIFEVPSLALEFRQKVYKFRA